MKATPLTLMSGLSAPAHYANGIKIAEQPASLITELLRHFVQSDFLWPRLAKKSAVPTHYMSICISTVSVRTFLSVSVFFFFPTSVLYTLKILNMSSKLQRQVGAICNSQVPSGGKAFEQIPTVAKTWVENLEGFWPETSKLWAGAALSCLHVLVYE